tara:strand:+ start:462 stop:785 length:324 start_codon:yes stop_codon:yes gene_type:complete
VRRSLDIQHTTHATKRLEHTLKVLDVTNFNGHVDPTVLILIGRCLYVPDVGVDTRDPCTYIRQNTLPILHLDRQPYNIRRWINSAVPCDGDAPSRIVEPIEHVRATY